MAQSYKASGKREDYTVFNHIQGDANLIVMGAGGVFSLHEGDRISFGDDIWTVRNDTLIDLNPVSGTPTPPAACPDYNAEHRAINNALPMIAAALDAIDAQLRLLRSTTGTIRNAMGSIGTKT